MRGVLNWLYTNFIAEHRLSYLHYSYHRIVRICRHQLRLVRPRVINCLVNQNNKVYCKDTTLQSFNY